MHVHSVCDVCVIRTCMCMCVGLLFFFFPQGPKEPPIGVLGERKENKRMCACVRHTRVTRTYMWVMMRRVIARPGGNNRSVMSIGPTYVRYLCPYWTLIS